MQFQIPHPPSIIIILSSAFALSMYALGLSHQYRIRWSLRLVTRPSVAGGGGVDKLCCRSIITLSVTRSVRCGGQTGLTGRQWQSNCLKIPHFSAVSQAMKLPRKISSLLSVETT
mmetsp:Transcript_15266/g.24801  ORF Transcript_15266/g.24801 Transcript_15266/m.24801 type:complete len:115 (-) Transcript_15266:112-456(-)